MYLLVNRHIFIKYLEITYIGPPEIVRDVRDLFLVCGAANPDECTIARASVHLQAVQKHAQEIFDDKFQVVQTIEDLIDNKRRSLDVDYKKLSEYLNNPEESEDDQSEDIKHLAKSVKHEVSSSSEELSPDEVELPSNEEVCQDEGELSSDDVEMPGSKDSEDNVMADDDDTAMSADDNSAMSDDDDSAMSENTEISEDLNDYVSTENSEGTNLPGETLNPSDYTDTSDNYSD